jgi:hypothetical protein
MDRFVNDQNLEMLRRLASGATSEAERKILFGLLGAEKVKFNELQKAGTARPVPTEALPLFRTS